MRAKQGQPCFHWPRSGLHLGRPGAGPGGLRAHRPLRAAAATFDAAGTDVLAIGATTLSCRGESHVCQPSASAAQLGDHRVVVAPLFIGARHRDAWAW